MIAAHVSTNQYEDCFLFKYFHRCILIRSICFLRSLYSINNKAMKPVLILSIINAALILFHLLVLFGVIPFDLVWGGKLSSVEEMYKFELPALGISLLFQGILFMEAKKTKFRLSKQVRKMFLIGFLLLFVLNTLGNIMANSLFEKAFAVVTALMVFLIFILLKKRP